MGNFRKQRGSGGSRRSRKAEGMGSARFRPRDARGDRDGEETVDRSLPADLADDPRADLAATMKRYGLQAAFPDKVLRDAHALARAGLETPGERLDLRRKFVFTCDPVTARDYDDALSFERDRKGRRVLGVHIADVSHFVRAGSDLDREAYRRSTSVYLVGKVVPMLPEELSNGVCSLVPGEDRLAFSVFLTFDGEGRCVASRFAKSVIRSKARFTYEQVMGAILRSRGGRPRRAASAETLPKRAEETVLAIAALAAQLRARRFAAGALDMDVPETEILLDGDGMMTGLEIRRSDESHQLVEECMVAANEAVARALWTNGVRILARLHEPPLPERVDELKENLALLGLTDAARSVDPNRPETVGAFLRELKGHPLESLVTVMVLRSMKRAVYAARTIGHYGLAKDFYAHFTSPIRRYPDLVLHRQLADWIAGRGARGRLDRGWLDRAAEHCSERERLADEAERALVELKKYRFLAEGIASGASVYGAVVGRVTRFGLFVDVPDLAVSGMVHVSKLARSFVRFDAATGSLVARGKRWSLGDKLEVRACAVDFRNRWVDFEPAESGGER